MMSCYVFHHVMFLHYTKLVCSKAIHHHLTSQFSLNSPVPCDFQDEMDYSGQVLQCETAAGKKHASRNQKSYCWALKSLLQATSLLQVQSLLNVFFKPSSAFLFFLLILFFTDFSYRNMDAIQSFNHVFFFLKSDKQILGDIFGICIKSHRDLKHSYLSFSADRECIYLQIPI